MHLLLEARARVSCAGEQSSRSDDVYYCDGCMKKGSGTMAPSSAVAFTAYAKPVQFLVRNVLVVYEPSVHGGDGSETRVNITLRCDDESTAAIRALEGIDDFSLISAVKEAGVRAKLDKNAVRIYDESGNPTSAPAVWRGARVNAALTAQWNLENAFWLRHLVGLHGPAAAA